MQRVNRLLNDPQFQQAAARIAGLEEGRRYCRHTMQHFLDVARIAYILSLEEGGDLPKPVVYAAGLLHDLGRSRAGEDHHLAGAELAARLLPPAGFDEEETALIARAIAAHRRGGPGLAGWLHRADRLSRPCRECHALDACHRFPAGAVPPGLEY